MSSRQMKKLQAQEEKRKALAALGEKEKSSSGEEEETVVEARPRAKNVFAAFAALGGEDEDEDAEEDVAEGGEEVGEQEGTQNPQPAPKPKRKKKKAKAKKKANGSEGEGESGPAVTMTSVTAIPGKKHGKGAKATIPAMDADDGLDEIDRALKALNMQPASKKATSGSEAAPANAAHGPRMGVDLHDLRVMNELRGMFGRETIQAARVDEAHNAGNPQGERVEGNPGVVMVDLETYLRGTLPGMGRRQGAQVAAAMEAAGRRGLADAVVRRNPFIEFKDTWPRAPSGGLGMQQVTPVGGEVGGVAEYAFTHGPAYMTLDDMFFALVTTPNHYPLIQFLKQNPYHVASLIQVSQVAKQDQNAALAADLCERALFAFGRATLSSFRQKIGEGLARLSFRRPENRQFLLAGYHYVRSLIPRGTHRTALAWVRLLLGVMPDDPYGLVLWVHALAVRAGEEQWLLDAVGGYEDEDKDTSSMLPALRNHPMRAYIRQSAAVARLELGDEAGAHAAVTAGLAQLPWLYAALFQALGRDVPHCVWGAQPRDDTEALYTQLYVLQARDLWETGPATALLDAAAAAAPKSDASSLAAAAPVSPSIARFVYLDGIPAIMALVPGELLHASPNYDFDPLPPAREDNVFSHFGQERPWIVAANEETLDGDPGWDLEAVMARTGVREGPDRRPRWAAAPDEGLDEEDFDGGGEDDNDDGNEDDHDDGSNEPPQESSHEQYARQRTGGMPGAWVEDVEDDEYE